MPDFTKVATVADVSPGDMKVVEVDGQQVVLANLGGEFYAFSNECTHQGGPLGEGYLVDDTVECPWHGGQFSIKTGEVVSPPPPEKVATYQVQVEGQDISIAVS